VRRIGRPASSAEAVAIGSGYPARHDQVTLFDALYAFFREHQYCGDLDGGVEGDRVWMTCTCGAVLVRVVRFG